MLQYSYATPVVGKPHEVAVNDIDIPENATRVATAHTHPNSNEFSGLSPGTDKGDIHNAIKRGINSYVIGPNLKLQKYIVSLDSVCVVGIAAPRLITTQEKSSLMWHYQSSWREHLDDCNDFDCVNIPWPTFLH